MNFNPNHDNLGRFASGQGLHLGYTGQPIQLDLTIRAHSYASPDNPTCVPVGLQTLIVTANPQEAKNAPQLEKIKADVEAAAGKINAEIKAETEQYNANVKDPAKKRHLRRVTVEWRHGGVGAVGRDYAAVMQEVLSQHGVKSTVRLGDDRRTRMTMKEPADTLVAKGTPAMLNIGANLSNEHAVTVQWDPDAGSGKDKGRFLVNNLLSEGGTKEFTRKEFEFGTLRAVRVGTGGLEASKHSNPVINLSFPVIFTEKP